MLNGTIPSAVSDTGATSSAFLKKDPSRTTGELSTTVIHLPDGAIAPATTRNKLLHNMHEPACSVNIIPALVENSLLSTIKFAEAGYTVIYDKDEVNFYDARTMKIMVSRGNPHRLAMPTPENVAHPPCPHCHKFEHGHATPGPPIGAGQPQRHVRSQLQYSSPQSRGTTLGKIGLT
jgi:hypothetical protein